MSAAKKNETKLVPQPATNFIPERDVGRPPVLEAINLGIDFGGLTAVEDFNIGISPTEIAGLIGPNGAGKTTVFNLLTKVYQPTHGTILLNGKDTMGMSTVQVNQAGIARTFQNIRLFNNLTVEDNIKLGLHNHIGYGMFSGIFRLPRYWREEKKSPCTGAGTALHLPYGAYGGLHCRQPALWRPKAAGNYPRFGHRPQTASAG